jgi:hypothetical protein
MTRAEINRRYYDKTRRRTHAGKFAPICGMSGPVGKVPTCKTCLMVEKTRKVGSRINEWERKRLEALFRKQSAQRSAAWRARNPESARAASRRWHAKNRDLVRVSNRQWAERNREHRRAYNAAYQAAKKSQSQTASEAM